MSSRYAEHAEQKTRPHERQWCLRRKVEKDEPHPKHRLTRSSGIHVTGKDGRIVHSFRPEFRSTTIDIDKSVIHRIKQM